MTDALCGPSNALQTFQKQTNVDRTLQQDRLAVRHTQAESFRTLPGRNAGILDAEFEAFQADRPLEAIYPEPQLFPQQHPPSSFQTKFQQTQPGLSDWASDFKSLNLSDARASPIPSSQFHHHAPLQHHSPSGWNQDFLGRTSAQESTQMGNQQHIRRGGANGWANGFTGGLIPHQENTMSSIAQQKQPGRLIDDTYDEAAFERAFENARSELDLQQRDVQLDQDLYRTQEAAKTILSPEREAWLDHSRIGSDRISDEAEEKSSQEKDQEDADELARTAGQLLENVKSDRSKKFQESNFLSLMRQLRDKEVRVEGDKLVDVAQPLHPGGKHYPNVGLQSTNWREDSVLRYEHSDLTYEDEEIENPGHFMHRLGLDPQNAKNNELLKLMESEALRVYNQINHSPDTLKPELSGTNPPYRYNQLTEESIMAAINTVRDNATPETYAHYMWGQRAGDPDNWVIRRMLYHVCGDRRVSE